MCVMMKENNEAPYIGTEPKIRTIVAIKDQPPYIRANSKIFPVVAGSDKIPTIAHTSVPI